MSCFPCQGFRGVKGFESRALAGEMLSKVSCSRVPVGHGGGGKARAELRVICFISYNAPLFRVVFFIRLLVSAVRDSLDVNSSEREREKERERERERERKVY